jgi:hypothetical protein
MDMPVKKVLWSEPVRSRIDQGQPYFLQRASLKPVLASRAADFLSLALAERPDLIVLPAIGIDRPAIDLLKALRTDDRTRGIPVVALSRGGPEAAALRQSGCAEVFDTDIAADDLQGRIARAAGMHLRRHVRYHVVLPVARGRILSDFLGYSTNLSEGGIGFDTLTRLKQESSVHLRIYRNSEEKPIKVDGRVVTVRPNIGTGVGYAIGMEFRPMPGPIHDRIKELFPGDGSVIWGPDPPTAAPS